MPSRFLGDIDPSLLMIENEGENDTFNFNAKSKQKPIMTRRPEQKERPVVLINPNRHRIVNISQSNPSSSTTFDTPMLSEGNIIEHQRFGLGTVIKIEGRGENTKATVEFKNLGTKQLLLKFARYKVVR